MTDPTMRVEAGLTERPRRLRRSKGLRRMVRETRVGPEDLVLPLFAVPGRGVSKPIASMPGHAQLSVDLIAEEAAGAAGLGIPAVLLFGVPERKDEMGAGAYDPEGIAQQAVRAIKRRAPELVVITDTCLCEYTSHGHCGRLDDSGYLLNDESLDLLVRTAVSQAEAGADVVAPSAMLDGQVGAIREALDARGFAETAILAYAVKYASAFYAPFREAAESAPQSGDRSTHQMDPANWREARREAALDEAEGADIIMVKPALCYLDIVRQIREQTDLPVAAYNVSGEFSLVKAAAQQGWIEEERVVGEILASIKRAGADFILTYHAKDFLRWQGR